MSRPGRNSRIERFYNRVYYDQWKQLRPKVLRRQKRNYFDLFLRILGVTDSSATDGQRILDVACGEGFLLREAERKGLEGYGIDISEVALRLARQRTGSARLACADVNRGLPYPDGFFDYVTCIGSLEHFEAQDFVVQEITRVVKETGSVGILVPNHHYILHRVGVETDDQPVVNRFSLSGWKRLLSRNGLRIAQCAKFNRHLGELSESSSYLRHLVKLILHPFLPLLPLSLSYEFYFVCSKPEGNPQPVQE